MTSTEGCMIFPNRQEMMEFLGVSPTEETDDGYCLYEISDEDQTLKLSFDVIERSIQTVISFQGQERIRVSQECAVSLKIIEGKFLQGRFEYNNARSIMEIYKTPSIFVKWYTLENE